MDVKPVLQSELKQEARLAQSMKHMRVKEALSWVARNYGYSSYDQYIQWCRDNRPDLLDEQEKKNADNEGSCNSQGD